MINFYMRFGEGKYRMDAGDDAVNQRLGRKVGVRLTNTVSITCDKLIRVRLYISLNAKCPFRSGGNLDPITLAQLARLVHGHGLFAPTSGRDTSSIKRYSCSDLQVCRRKNMHTFIFPLKKILVAIFESCHRVCNLTASYAWLGFNLNEKNWCCVLRDNATRTLCYNYFKHTCACTVKNNCLRDYRLWGLLTTIQLWFKNWISATQYLGNILRRCSRAFVQLEIITRRLTDIFLRECHRIYL